MNEPKNDLRADARGDYAEERMIYGDPVSNPELHNKRRDANQGCHELGDGTWCFKETTLTVKVP